MEIPVKSPKLKKQKTCETSTEDRDILDLTSAKAVRTTIDGMQADLTGGRMNLKCLLTVTEEPGNLFTFGSFNHYASASRPSFKKHLYIGGMPLRRLANGVMNFHFFWRKLENLYLNGPAAATIKPPAGILDSSLIIPVEASFVRVANDRKREVDWSSLPVLPLWKIMDRLDVFDNRRLGAVCRDWWSVSVRYPKKLYSVGDGEPWIGHMKYGMQSTTWEFISVSKNRKFEVDMPEFANSQALFSKGGWILLHTGGYLDWRGELCSWCLVNLFTRDKIELPKREGKNARCCGLFKLGDDGCPDRVYLIISEGPYQVHINTARPGDKEWAIHNFTGLNMTFHTLFTHFAIGDTVYCQGGRGSGIAVFNLANNSVKVLRPLSRTGYIREHEGELLYVDRAEVVSKK